MMTNMAASARLINVSSRHARIALTLLKITIAAMTGLAKTKISTTPSPHPVHV
jgi:hypothetical protein